MTSMQNNFEKFQEFFETLKFNFSAVCPSETWWLDLEEALPRCSYKKVSWKNAANLQVNTHTKMWFQ